MQEELRIRLFRRSGGRGQGNAECPGGAIDEAFQVGNRGCLGEGDLRRQILKLERELSESVSRKIDIVEYSAIKPSIRERVLKEAIPIV